MPGCIGANGDTLIELRDWPQMDTGAPRPSLTFGSDALTLEYFAAQHSVTSPEAIVRVEFFEALAHILGAPNDEALSAHPLYLKGLGPYAAFEVQSSTWINNLEIQNRAHPFHKPEKYQNLRHYIVTFHDETFECVAKGYEVSAT